MNRTTEILSLLMLVGLSFSAGAIEIDVGDRAINIPIPDGYVELTPAMPPYYEALRAYTAETNFRYLTLIPANKAHALLRGKSVDLERYMIVESERGLSEASVSTATYDEIRELHRTQLGDIAADVNEQLPGIVDKGNANASEALGVDIDHSVGNFNPLPIHLDSANAFAYSSFFNVEASIDGGNTGSSVIAATVSILHVKDKVLFLYVYGAETDLGWTRTFSADWAERIVDGNPISAEVEQAINRTDSKGFDWSQVMEKAAIGALIGGLVGLFSFLSARRKKKDQGASD